ncbi:MAG: exo-alpha-sialidase [Kiritimatiellae bacterium]|nr:exo-alpha-sialidase [Kiritimatiellia bacterium]
MTKRKTHGEDRHAANQQAATLRRCGAADRLIAALAVAVASLLPAALAAGVEWRHVGAGMGGNSYWLTVDPNDDRTMFYSPDVGGVYRTKDGGETWKRLAVEFSHKTRISNWTLMTVAPSDSKTVYAAANQRLGDLDKNSPVDQAVIAVYGRKESGLACSRDGGDTWESLTGSPLRPGAIAVDPDDANTLWVAGPGYGTTCLLTYGKTYDPHGQGWVAKSTDGGRRWKYVYAGCRDNADACARDVCYSGLVVDRTSPKGRRTIYLSGNGGGVWKSADGGDTWAVATNGLPSSCVGAMTCSYGTDGKLSLYAAACFSPRPERFYKKLRNVNKPGIYRSDDGGATWRDVSGNLNRNIGRYRITVSPRDKDVMYTAQVRGTDLANEQKRTYKTVDGGKTWKPCMDYRDKSNLDADRWNNHYDYIGSPDTHIVVSQQNPDLLRFADAGCMMWESSDAGGHWRIITSTKVGKHRFRTRGMDNSFILSVSASPKNPDFLVMCCHDFDFLSSVDGGKSFFSGGQTGGIKAAGATDGCFGFMSVLHDKDDPKWAYVGSKGWSSTYSEGSVFLTTTDGGHTWHAPEANPAGMKLGSLADIFSEATMKRVEARGGGFFLDGKMLMHNWAIRQLVQSRSGRILAVKRTGVYFSDNRGGSWTRASFAGIGKDCDFAPNFLACDAETGRIWASVAYMPIFEGRGLSNSLSPTCMDKVFAPAPPDHKAGLYVSDDDGATFRPAGRRTPEMVLPTVIAVAPGGKAIYLGTSAANVSVGGNKASGRNRVEPAGLWQSLDGGESWRRVLGCRPARIEGCVQAVAVNPKRPEVVYAAVREALDSPALCAILRSMDGGTSWEDISGAASHGKYMWLSLSGADPAEILVGTGGGGAFIGHDYDVHASPSETAHAIQ